MSRDAVSTGRDTIGVGFGEWSKHLELSVLSKSGSLLSSESNRILFRLVQVESSFVGSGSFVGSEPLLIYALKIFNYEYC